jgi:hypothetical protein
MLVHQALQEGIPINNIHVLMSTSSGPWTENNSSVKKYPMGASVSDTPSNMYCYFSDIMATYWTHIKMIREWFKTLLSHHGRKLTLVQSVPDSYDTQ